MSARFNRLHTLAMYGVAALAAVLLVLAWVSVPPNGIHVEFGRSQPRIVRVCDPRHATACHCIDSELRWENGMVLCVEARR